MTGYLRALGDRTGRTVTNDGASAKYFFFLVLGNFETFRKKSPTRELNANLISGAWCAEQPEGIFWSDIPLIASQGRARQHGTYVESWACAAEEQAESALRIWARVRWWCFLARRARFRGKSPGERFEPGPRVLLGTYHCVAVPSSRTSVSICRSARLTHTCAW